MNFSLQNHSMTIFTKLRPRGPAESKGSADQIRAVARFRQLADFSFGRLTQGGAHRFACLGLQICRPDGASVWGEAGRFRLQL